MRSAYALQHGGPLPQSLTPCRHFLGTKLEKILDGEPQIENLEEVTNKEDGEEELLATEINRDGQIKVKKGIAKKIQRPVSSEELR